MKDISKSFTSSLLSWDHTSALAVQARPLRATTNCFGMSAMFPMASTSVMALRQTLSQSSRSLPSASSFHTSAALSAESKRKRLARLRKQANQARRAEAAEEARRTAPDLMLGYNPSSSQGQQLWADSKLNKILLRPDQVWGLSMAQARQSTQSAPSLDEGLEPEQSPATSDSDRVWNFGLKSDEADVLFKALPEVNTQRLQTTDPAELQAGAALEDNKVDQIKRILDLKNANAKGIDVENKRRIVEAFGHRSLDSKPDTGCPEVQGELLQVNSRWSLKLMMVLDRRHSDRPHSQHPFPPKVCQPQRRSFPKCPPSLDQPARESLPIPQAAFVGEIRAAAAGLRA